MSLIDLFTPEMTFIIVHRVTSQQHAVLTWLSQLGANCLLGSINLETGSKCKYVFALKVIGSQMRLIFFSIIPSFEISLLG